MGNRVCGGSPQQCVDECTRLQFEYRSRDADEEHHCDPAGTVFGETLQGLAELDREALRFAGSPNLAAVRWLIAMGANPKARDKNGTTLLHAACRSGSCLIVQELVKQGLPLDAQDRSGWTPLHVAAVMGRRDLALLLVRVRANVSARNKNGALPVALCRDPGTMEVLDEFRMDGSVARPHPKPFLADMLVTNPGANHDDYTASCEPFFVPRIPLFQTQANRAEIIHLGKELFRRSSGHGLAFFVSTGAVHDHPTELSSFLLRQRVDPAQLGEFLGEDFSLAQTLRLAYIHSVDVSGTGVVGALVKAFQHMHAPVDLGKLDRLVCAIAHLWWRTHDMGVQDDYGGMPEDGSDLDWTMFGEDQIRAEEPPKTASEEVTSFRLRHYIRSIEGLRRLMFSTLMLYWNLHGAPRPTAASDTATAGSLTFTRWLDMNVGIEADGSNVPVHVQKGIFEAITRRGRLNALLPSDDRLAAERDAGASSSTLEAELEAQSTAAAAASSALNVEDTLLAVKGWATIPRGGLERNESQVGLASRIADCVMSETSSMPSPVPGVGRGRAAKPGDSEEQGEAVWLTLRLNLFLFLHASPADEAPYAFVRLQDCVLRDVNKATKSLTLAGRPKANLTKEGGQGSGYKPGMPFGDGSRLPLLICCLLADGRFQIFEAQWLELQFASDEELEHWSRELGVACALPQEKPPPAGLQPRIVADSFLDYPPPAASLAAADPPASCADGGQDPSAGAADRSRASAPLQQRPEPDEPVAAEDELGGPPRPAG